MPLPQNRVRGSKRPTLTKALVEGAAKPEAKQYDLQDNPRAGTMGIYMRVYPSGRRTFFYRRSRGEKAYKIGAAGPITLDGARTQAERIYNDLKEGTDPARLSDSNGLRFGTFF
ncbi:MAG: Arm DNA-binding domain-containing protein, partial [Gammaproteobacteria bacterium]|nr:Arm DNA-binding domain-containing protein [Gammaproteobacteria bacterium]